jgi:PAS domain S-box-containing protein
VTQNRRDGTRFPALAAVSRVKDEAGQPVGFVAVNRDISERKQAEAALKESDQKYSLLFDKSAVPAALLKLPEVVIVGANAAFEKLVGYTKSELYGKTAVELGLTSAARRSRAITTFEKQGSLAADETQVFTRSGEARVVLVNTNPVELGGERYAVSTMLDITARKQAEKQILQMQRLYATLSQVNQTIVRVKDHADLYQSICEVAVQFGGFAVAWVGLLNAETGRLPRPLPAELIWRTGPFRSPRSMRLSSKTG